MAPIAPILVFTSSDSLQFPSYPTTPLIVFLIVDEEKPNWPGVLSVVSSLNYRVLVVVDKSVIIDETLMHYLFVTRGATTPLLAFIGLNGVPASFFTTVLFSLNWVSIVVSDCSFDMSDFHAFVPRRLFNLDVLVWEESDGEMVMYVLSLIYMCKVFHWQPCVLPEDCVIWFVENLPCVDTWSLNGLYDELSIGSIKLLASYMMFEKVLLDDTIPENDELTSFLGHYAGSIVRL